MDKTFAALADPTRRAILTHLSAGPQSETALQDSQSLNRVALARHLDALEHAGLITRSGSEVKATTGPAQEAQDWLTYYLPLWSLAGPTVKHSH